MSHWHSFDEILSSLSGIAGALVSTRFVQGTVIQRITMAFGGASFSYYAAPSVAHYVSLPEGLAGFLLGLFGMSILSRVWEWLSTTNIIRDFLDAWLRRK